ncbi:MAG: hypothetical protein Q7T01_03265 [bacterium]|nr:hypothetical protein [bacterium]
MATKNLARTPLEAGNTGFYQDVRREQRRQHRHESKAYCRRARGDIAVYENAAEPVAPEHRNRRGLYNNELHGDRAGAVYAWIEAQVGRRWDDVYSDIRRMFDCRTLAGRHIVENHLPRPSDFTRDGRDGTWYSRNGRLFLDDGGVLRMRPHQRSRWKTGSSNAPSKEALMSWLAGRRIGCRGDVGAPVCFWLVRECIELYSKVLISVSSDGIVWGDRLAKQYSGYRQDRALSASDLVFFEELTRAQRKHVVDVLS